MTAIRHRTVHQQHDSDPCVVLFRHSKPAVGPQRKSSSVDCSVRSHTSTGRRHLAVLSVRGPRQLHSRIAPLPASPTTEFRGGGQGLAVLFVRSQVVWRRTRNSHSGGVFDGVADTFSYLHSTYIWHERLCSDEMWYATWPAAFSRGVGELRENGRSVGLHSSHASLASSGTDTPVFQP